MRPLPGETGKEKEVKSIRRAGLISLIPLIFLLDRIFKFFIVRSYAEGETLPVLPGFFHLTRVNNTGAAFGLLKNFGRFLWPLALGIVILLGFYLLRSLFGAARRDARLSVSTYASAFIIAGALGNLYDRLRYGYVIDFLDFRVWPVFNIADASICLGVFLIVFHFLWDRIAGGG